MVTDSSGGADVAVIDTLTVVITKQPDGTLVSEVADLPGCTARGATREELLEKTGQAINAFLGK